MGSIRGHVLKLSYTSLTKLTFCYISLQAAEFVNVTNKMVLVIGTQNPWLEAVLLTMKPKKIVTLEYGYFIRLGYFIRSAEHYHYSTLSHYPGLTFMRPGEFRERYLNGTLDRFDVVFTYSSVEHSGQGELHFYIFLKWSQLYFQVVTGTH